MTTILEGLSILESEHAFIVQEVRIEVAPLNQYVEAAHYFEAWEVKDGKVMGVKDADCDDMFRIGDDLDEDDLISADCQPKRPPVPYLAASL